MTSDNVKLTLKQSCVRQRNTMLKEHCHFQRRVSQRWTTSKQRFEYDYLHKIKNLP